MIWDMSRRAWVALRADWQSRDAKKRIARAARARLRLNATQSDASTYSLMAVVSAIAALMFAVFAVIGRDWFAALDALACLLNVTLFFARFASKTAALSDIDHIERLRGVAQGRPSARDFVSMSWQGQRPANEP